jgi:hypothetical protein
MKAAPEAWINRQLEYVDKQLINVWNQRGVYPGLGAMLSAFGVAFGFDIAHRVDTSENDLLSELKLLFSGDKEIGDNKLDAGLADEKEQGTDRLPHAG